MVWNTRNSRLNRIEAKVQAVAPIPDDQVEREMVAYEIQALRTIISMAESDLAKPLQERARPGHYSHVESHLGDCVLQKQIADSRERILLLQGEARRLGLDPAAIA